MQENTTWKKCEIDKIFLLKVYLAKLDKFPSFMNKRKQMYNLDTFSQQTQKHKLKVKTKFGNSSNLQQLNLFTEPIKEAFVNYTEPSHNFPLLYGMMTKTWGCILL